MSLEPFYRHKCHPCSRIRPGLDTKIVFLSSKIKKLQAQMFIFTTVHEIAPEDPLGIYIFQKFIYKSNFFPKGTL